MNEGEGDGIPYEVQCVIVTYFILPEGCHPFHLTHGSKPGESEIKLIHKNVRSFINH